MTGHHVVFDSKKIKKLINCKVIVRYGVGFEFNLIQYMKIASSKHAQNMLST